MRSTGGLRKSMNARSHDYEYVIVGLGKTGLSCARYLAGQGRRLAVADSREQPPCLGALREEYPAVPVFTGSFDHALFRNARELVVSPGVPLQEPAIRAAVEAGVEITGDIELFCRQAPGPVVAVTGSNGKSTVATLVHNMILAAGHRSALGGNIGTPALALLGDEVPDYFVLELSSFQLETVRSLSAKAAAVLNVSADHMDRYGNLSEYARAKARIYHRAAASVINLDDPLVAAMAPRSGVTLGFTLGVPPAGAFGVLENGEGRWLAQDTRPLMPVQELALHGEHNLANALAAMALGSALELPLDAMRSVLTSFPGLPHRCQRIASCGGVDWYNDSKGTNVGAACAAIRGLAAGCNIVLIAGGDGKGADFAPLGEVAAGRVRRAVLLGRDAPLLAKVLGPLLPVCFATDMAAAVATAARLARPRDIVLLSPACSSLDMFENYEHRGNVFSSAAQAVCREAGT